MAHVYHTHTLGTVLTSKTNAHSLTRGDQIVMPHLGEFSDVVTVRSFQPDRMDPGYAHLTVADREGSFSFPVKINDPLPRVVGGRSIG